MSYYSNCVIPIRSGNSCCAHFPPGLLFGTSLNEYPEISYDVNYQLFVVTEIQWSFNPAEYPATFSLALAQFVKIQNSFEITFNHYNKQFFQISKKTRNVFSLASSAMVR